MAFKLAAGIEVTRIMALGQTLTRRDRIPEK